ncbi:hypothetical protein BM536_003240 [Streptomyces phaeoluteigriseus]|uniref:Uncharacterized protein n=1 Tax=Streptomyces phaeoluteigriseus TaxID=114686 RepID=A0A1V6MXA6_9ACTN|nr:hypothetical protein [Streptomyces phaeoluteigriseus]OQD57090.1 hypothetical protein BM536_003240 [Streptomyces phaeoluteigriseus]
MKTVGARGPGVESEACGHGGGRPGRQLGENPPEIARAGASAGTDTDTDDADADADADNMVLLDGPTAWP